MKTDIFQRFDHLSKILQSSLNDQGFWEGALSSSALASAVAVVALELGDPVHSRERIDRGMHWLADNINHDGGFGDTPCSVSNVSTTLLCYAAFARCTSENKNSTAIQLCMKRYLHRQGVDITSTGVVGSILGYYGKDYTFSLPILSMLVLCNVLDGQALKKIPQLPFELTLLPPSIYRFFNLQVVSYAIPALVGVGIYLFRHKPRPNPLTALIRSGAINRALLKLEQMMPDSGGFLEAIPLTAFVAMCLVSSGYADHKVVEQGIGFLKRQQRSDGSWPIDTNLANWVTTLSVKALGPRLSAVMDPAEQTLLRSYLINSQYKLPHRFNKARPGGWGWTSFTGSVPDADDTAGAILALLTLDPEVDNVKTSILNGSKWLGALQNRDGGIPTFCRGWGRLPFDASCADLTGHALLAWAKVIESLSMTTASNHDHSEIRRLKKYINRALRFLEKRQRTDGAWLPLWFGHQQTADKTNPVYGTARVMCYLDDALQCSNLDTIMCSRMKQMIAKSGNFLATQQNDDGSWGAVKGVEGSMEETAMAVSALIKHEPSKCVEGLNWLDRQYDAHGLIPKPIGLYFASLWYHEKMYPLVYYLEALRKAIGKAILPIFVAITTLLQ